MSYVSDLTRANWREELESSDEVARNCASCRHAVPNPLLPNGARVTPDGHCRLLDATIRHADRQRCRGWQSAWHGVREEASADAAELLRIKELVTRMRKELERTAPRVKLLRRLTAGGAS